MYNRYIGNTGKFYRVDDRPHEQHEHAHDTPGEHDSRREPSQPQPRMTPQYGSPPIRHAPQRPNNSGSLFNLPELVGGVKGLVNGILPKGTDISDLLLIIVLLLLYLEKEDEEILIMLSVLIFMGFK